MYLYILESRLPNLTWWFSLPEDLFCSGKGWWKSYETNQTCRLSETGRGSHVVDSKTANWNKLNKHQASLGEPFWRWRTEYQWLHQNIPRSGFHKGLDRIHSELPGIWQKWRLQNYGSISSSLNAGPLHPPS